MQVIKVESETKINPDGTKDIIIKVPTIKLKFNQPKGVGADKE